MNDTIPGGDVFQPESDRPAYVNVPSHHKDAVTGATWVHKDLVQVQEAWAEEEHVGPVQEHILLGDIESFTDYVTRFGNPSALVTWNTKGLVAVLDYHGSDEPGRCDWRADYAFERSREWQAWMGLCSAPQSQQAAVDKLEDLAESIREPGAADLMTILRGLRANVSSEAVTEFTPEGDTRVSFRNQSTVRAASGATVTVPSEIRIAIPVLKGHTTTGDDGKAIPVLYELTVKVRPSVDGNSKVQLRFSIPLAEKVLEEVIAERVAAAKALLTDGFKVYRAAD